MSLELYKNSDEIKNGKGQIRGERYNKRDLNIIPNTQVETNFSADNTSDVLELHVYDLNDNLIASELDAQGWIESGFDENGKITPAVNVDIHRNLRTIGFDRGKFRVTYNFLRDKLGSTNGDKFYISEISPSRTEIKIRPVEITSFGSLFSFFKFSNSSPDTNAQEYWADLFLNFGGNRLILAINWKSTLKLNNLTGNTEAASDLQAAITAANTTGDLSGFYGVAIKFGVVIFKLYDPLPGDIQVKDQLWVVNEVSNPIIEQVQLIPTDVDDELANTLRGPNFDIEVGFSSGKETIYKSWNDILGSDAQTSQQLIDGVLSGSLSEIQLNTDYTEYDNFIHFSSAAERLTNFKFKANLLENFDKQLQALSLTGPASSSTAVLNNITTITAKKNKVVGGFDGYEKFLYSESGSIVSSSFGFTPLRTWPKRNSLRPFVLYSATSSQAIDWFDQQFATASSYDHENPDSLIRTVPDHIRLDEINSSYELFVNMMGQHYDTLWAYIDELTQISKREESLSEGLAKDLIYDVATSLGWEFANGNELEDLWSYALGTDASGNLHATGSETVGETVISGSADSIPRGDITKEIWKRILNNLPYLLKAKGTSAGVRALITCYGVPSTILRIKEYGGPNVEDRQSQYIIDKFRHALKFNGSSQIETRWRKVQQTQRVPETVELRFKTLPSKDKVSVRPEQILAQSGDQWAIKLVQSSSNDNGFIQFVLSGSDGYKTGSTPSIPVFDGDFWSVMLRRASGSEAANVTQSYDLFVAKNFCGKVVHKSTASVQMDPATSQSYNTSFVTATTMSIGGTGSTNISGEQFTGSMQEFRYWSINLDEMAFDNHVTSPNAYDSNFVTSSFDHLALRYTFNDNIILPSTGVGSAHPNQKIGIFATGSFTLSGSAVGFGSTNPYEAIEEKYFIDFPNIGGNRYTSNKVRIEDNKLTKRLSVKSRAEKSAFDTAPIDSNKLGIFFSPVDEINEDIAYQIGGQNLDNFIGDPDDEFKDTYEDLEGLASHYWKKYPRKNNFFDYIRLIKFYDASLFRQIKRMLPERASSTVGLLIEPHLLERPKVKKRRPDFDQLDLLATSSLLAEDHISGEAPSTTQGEQVTGSFSFTVGQFNGLIPTRTSFPDGAQYTFDNLIVSGNTFITSSVELEGVFQFISSSVVSQFRQIEQKFYSSSFSAAVDIAYSSSYEEVEVQDYIGSGLENSFFNGVKMTSDDFNIDSPDTIDGGPVVEITETNPNKLIITQPGGDGNLNVQ